MNLGDPERMAAHVKSLTDADPWDVDHSRHAVAMERLEGRAANARRLRVCASEEPAAVQPSVTPKRRLQACANVEPVELLSTATPKRRVRTLKRMRHTSVALDRDELRE